MFEPLTGYTTGIEGVEELSKLSVGVVCSRMLAEMLWRIGVGTVRYVGDFISPQDVYRDVSLSLDDASNYDVLHSKGNTLVISALAESLDVDFFTRALRGCDVIIAHRYCHTASKAAERLGALFMPCLVSSVLPEDLKREDVVKAMKKVEEYRPENPMCYAMLCSAQVLELLRMCSGDRILIAPEAMIPSEKPPFFENIKIW